MDLHLTRDYRVLIVPGLHGSGPAHWQTRWQQLHPFFERVEQLQWDVPDLDAWSARLDGALRASTRPAVVVAHSFGCLTTVACAEVGRIAGALLVAPADPYKFGVAARVRRALPVPSIVIGSTNDPWMNEGDAGHWADLWDSAFFNAGPLGHINADSGLGDWRFGLFCLHQLLVSVNDDRALRRRARLNPRKAGVEADLCRL